MTKNVGDEEVMKRSQGRQSPADGSDGLTLRLTVRDVGTYITDSDAAKNRRYATIQSKIEWGFCSAAIG